MQKKGYTKKLQEELDTRNWWLGLRLLKNDYKPIPYSIQGKDGKPIPFGNKKTEGMAQLLADKF